MVDPVGQVGDLHRLATGLGLTFLILEAHQRILIGDVEVAVGQRQAVRRVEVVRKHFLQFIHAIAIRIP